MGKITHFVDLSGTTPEFSETGAKSAVPALTQHPHFFDDIRLLAKNAGLAEPPFVELSTLQNTPASADKMDLLREKDGIITSSRLAMKWRIWLWDINRLHIPR